MSRSRLALIAFAFHAPGLRLIAGMRLGRGVLFLNAASALATLACLAFVASRGGDWKLMLVTWLIGHFNWSIVLAAMVYFAMASEPRRA